MGHLVLRVRLRLAERPGLLRQRAPEQPRQEGAVRRLVRLQVQRIEQQRADALTQRVLLGVPAAQIPPARTKREACFMRPPSNGNVDGRGGTWSRGGSREARTTTRATSAVGKFVAGFSTSMSLYAGLDARNENEK